MQLEEQVWEDYSNNCRYCIRSSLATHNTSSTNISRSESEDRKNDPTSPTTSSRSNKTILIFLNTIFRMSLTDGAKILGCRLLRPFFGQLAFKRMCLLLFSSIPYD